MNHYRIAFSSLELGAKLPPGDPRWKTFNSSFENLEASAIAIGWMIDEGRAFTSWHDHSWRTSDNFLCGQHLGIDFDTRSVDDALADPFVDRYAALVYATPSSTPESPRSRALFLLDAPIMQTSNYVRAATALIWSFGGAADRQCKDAARFFYGSLACIPTRRDLELPLSVVKQLIVQWEAAQQIAAAQQHAPARPYTPRTPDAADAQKLLARISPKRADDYGDWITVGMALRSLDDEGLRLWDDWSRRSQKHVDGECQRKWGTFGATGVTLATLGLWAKQDSPS